MESENLFEPIETAARKKGVWAELWGEFSEGLSVERRDCTPYAVKPFRETVLAVRVIHRHRAGLSYTTRATPESLLEAMERAYEMSLFSEEEAHPPEGGELPSLPAKVPDIPASAELERLLLQAEEAVFSADSRVHRVERASLSGRRTQYFIFQTRGVKTAFTSGSFAFLLSVVARSGKEERTAWEWREAPSLEELSPEALSRQAVQRAVTLLGARKVPSQRVAVLFPPVVAVQLLESLASSFCADEVARGRSRLAGQEGKRIFSPCLTLIDDGLWPGGPETRPFDDEGTPQKRTLLVEKGRVVSFLYNVRWARHFSTVSTGNARRPSFRAHPAVAPTNLYLSPGDHPREDLCHEGVFEVYEMLGWHTTDPVSGDFSVGVSGVLHTAEGPRPVSGMALSGNLFELLSRVSAVGSDLTFYGDTGSPSLLVPDLDLSGA